LALAFVDRFLAKITKANATRFDNKNRKKKQHHQASLC
jgi:hypothetical protein